MESDWFEHREDDVRMWKAAVCDDEAEQAELLAGYVKEWGARRREPVEVTVFPSAEAFRFAWEEDKEWFVLLLDIQMAGEDGMSLARYVREQDASVPIIFSTGLAEHMEEGFDVQALHYLLKPVKKEKLCECLDRAVEKGAEEPFVLTVTVQGEQAKVLRRDIMYVDADAHTVKLHMKADTVEVKGGIKSWAKTLEGPDFIQCHRSFVAGLRHVAKLRRFEVALDDGTVLPVSRRIFMDVNRAFVAFYREALEV